MRISRSVVFFTGAGISTESGVPDFRSPGGVWTKYQPVLFQDFLASEAARVQHWQLKKATYELFKTVKPNIGHHAICDFEQRGQLLGLITQNIDGLHKLAGTSDEKLVELHGTDRLVTCLKCAKVLSTLDVYENLAEDFTAPTCDDCGGFLKSANVSFGQSMPIEAMQRAQAWSEQADIFVVIGSSLQVQPAASFSHRRFHSVLRDRLGKFGKRTSSNTGPRRRQPTRHDDQDAVLHRIAARRQLRATCGRAGW